MLYFTLLLLYLGSHVTSHLGNAHFSEVRIVLLLSMLIFMTNCTNIHRKTFVIGYVEISFFCGRFSRILIYLRVDHAVLMVRAHLQPTQIHSG